MKIPNRVRIKLGVTYDVVFQDKIPDDYKGRKVHGYCDGTKKIICISKDQSEREQTKTFIHELLHAMSDENKISLEHKYVYKLEEAIYRLLKLNNLIKK